MTRASICPFTVVTVFGTYRMWPNWCRQGIVGHTPAWHRAPLLGNKSGQHFPPEQPDGAEGVLAWHPWPLAAQDELFHP
jgi:hypothetical protein